MSSDVTHDEAQEEGRSSQSSSGVSANDNSGHAGHAAQEREWPSRIRDASFAGRSAEDEQDDHRSDRSDDETSGKGRMTARPDEAQRSAHTSQEMAAVPSPALAVAGPSTVERDGLPHIAVTDYSDRQRLLYQLTYLTTQLQRAQLQLQEQQRTILLLRAAARQAIAHDATANPPMTIEAGSRTGAAAHTRSQGAPQLPPPTSCVESFTTTTTTANSSRNEADEAEGGKTVQIRIAASALTAALLAAQEERQLHDVLQANLALFDPILAQTQIHRLDSALAQLGLLREVELQRLRAAEQELHPLRSELAKVKAELQAVRGQRDELQTLSTQQHGALAAATVEVQRLRGEEVRLNRQMAEMEALREDGTLLGQVRLVGRGAAGDKSLLQACEEAEQAARQALLQGLFYEPMLIAFDAGLTWMTDTARLRATQGNRKSHEGEEGEKEEDEEEDVAEARLVVRSGIAAAASEVCDALRAPATDVDLLLMRHQHEELTALRGRLQVVQERLHRSQLEADRLRQLYEGEQRRSETLAQTHAAQLQRAYDQVQKDGEVILRTLRSQVAEQVERAYRDGRREERRRWRLREPQQRHHNRHPQPRREANKPAAATTIITTSAMHRSTLTSSSTRYSSSSSNSSSGGSGSYICAEHRTPRHAQRQRYVPATRRPTNTKMA